MKALKGATKLILVDKQGKEKVIRWVVLLAPISLREPTGESCSAVSMMLAVTFCLLPHPLVYGEGGFYISKTVQNNVSTSN